MVIAKKYFQLFSTSWHTSDTTHIHKRTVIYPLRLSVHLHEQMLSQMERYTSEKVTFDHSLSKHPPAFVLHNDFYTFIYFLMRYLWIISFILLTFKHSSCHFLISNYSAVGLLHVVSVYSVLLFLGRTKAQCLKCASKSSGTDLQHFENMST